VIFNIQERKYKLIDRVRRAIENTRYTIPYSNDRNFDESKYIEITNALGDKRIETDNKIAGLNLFNVAEIEQAVSRFEKYCSDVASAVSWFKSEFRKLEEFNTKFTNELPSEYPIIGNLGKDYVLGKVYQLIEGSRRTLKENIYTITTLNYRNIPYKNTQQLEFEAKQILDEYKIKIQNEKDAAQKIELEKAKAIEDAKVRHDIESIKQNYEQQRLADQKELEEEKLRLKKEFDLQVESTVNEFIGKRLEQELSNQEAKIRQDFIENNHHKIEEEVNKRVDNEIRATLKRKDQVLQEQSELLKVQQKKEIEAIEGKYNKLIRGIEDHHKDVTRTLEERVRYLENRLEETIAKYEAIFQSKYQDEIESRAKELAKEFLKKEFPFE